MWNVTELHLLCPLFLHNFEVKQTASAVKITLFLKGLQRLYRALLYMSCMRASVCICVYMWLFLHHMLGDRVRIGEEKKKINDLKNECIAAFTHWRRQAKYSSSFSSHCSILLQARGLGRDTRRPRGVYLFNNGI